MAVSSFALFDTAIGRCGIAWSERGVIGIQLPERRDVDTRKRLRGRFPDAREDTPPAAVRPALDGIAALLRGEASDLSVIALDLELVPPFHRRVYEVARTIPPGATLSYGEIARELGSLGSARAVGQALGRNPFAILVPCHRVLAADGRSAASLRMAASRPSCVCCRSKCAGERRSGALRWRRRARIRSARRRARARRRRGARARHRRCPQAAT